MGETDKGEDATVLPLMGWAVASSFLLSSWRGCANLYWSLLRPVLVTAATYI